MTTNNAIKPVLLFCILFMALSLACRAATGEPPKPVVSGVDEAARQTVQVIERTEPRDDGKPPAPTRTAGPSETPEPTSTPRPTATAKPTATPTVIPLGFSRSKPFAAGSPAAVPNWTVQVREVRRGEEAWKTIQAANFYNDPAPEGMEYVLIKLWVQSRHDDESAENSIGACDFAVTGDRLRLYTCNIVSILVPEPRLDARLYSGGETEGWVAYLVGQGEGSLLLMVDETFNFSDSANRYLQIEEGAVIEISPRLANIEPSDLGRERSKPAPMDAKVITDDWELAVQEVIRGEEAWLMIKKAYDYNDPPASGMEYLAVKLYVRYIGTEEKPAFMNSYAFKTTGGAGVLYDLPFVMFLTPGMDVNLFPGGEHVGWVVVQAAEGESGVRLVFEPWFDYDGRNKRFISLE
jgi:hypothetical protein